MEIYWATYLTTFLLIPSTPQLDLDAILSVTVLISSQLVLYKNRVVNFLLEICKNRQSPD